MHRMQPEELTLNAYQSRALQTKSDQSDQRLAVANWAMGLAGETGELVDLLKKVYFHGHVLDRGALVKELGDVQWYLAILAEQLGISLQEIGRAHV